MAMLNNQRVSEYEKIWKVKKTSYTMNGMIFHIAKLNMGKSRWAILKGHSVHYELVPFVLVIGNQFDDFDSLFSRKIFRQNWNLALQCSKTFCGRI